MVGNLGKGFGCNQEGITDVETAIVLIAFVVVSSVFAFTALSTDLFATDKAKQTIYAFLAETGGTIFWLKPVALWNSRDPYRAPTT